MTAVALDLIDEGGAGGFDRLTLAAVAARAGVAVPSLYKHVSSLDDLRRLVATESVNELTRVLAAATIGRSGPDALRSAADAKAEMVAAYDRRRRLMVHGFRTMGLDCFGPLGAFYVLPSIAKAGLSSDEFAEQLLKEEKVAVVPGTAFGPSGEGHIRCSYAYSLEQLEEALQRIARFVQRRI